MPASPPRLFLALTVPPPVRAALATLCEPLPGVAWTRPDQLHVTLRFLGPVAEAQQESLRERLAALRVEPFILPVEGLGTFPPNRPPRVAWIGVGAGHPRLFQLRQRCDDALLAAGLALDCRHFHPHITLARCRESAAGLAPWLQRHRDFSAPPFRAVALDLYASRLRPDGAEHTLVQSFPLAK